MKEFKFMEWNVELIQNPIKLDSKLKELDILNKEIINVRTISTLYDNLDINKALEIDKPIEFIFFDNNKLEIDYSEGSTIKIGYNSLQEYKKYNVPKELNEYVKNEKIVSYNIETVDKDTAFCEFTGSYGLKLNENQSGGYIGNLQFNLTNNKKIIFINFYDYGEIQFNS